MHKQAFFRFLSFPLGSFCYTTKMTFTLRTFFLAFLLSLPFILAACGFTPMYGKNDVMTALDMIAIENIPNREGQFLRNALVDRFYRHGRPSNFAYLLKIEPLEENLTDLDITKNSSATRAQLRMSTTMSLLDRMTGDTLIERPLTAVTSYNVLQSQFTTRVSEQDARDAAISELARQIETQLALYFNHES